MAFWLFIAGGGIYVAAAGYTDLRMQRHSQLLDGSRCARRTDLLVASGVDPAGLPDDLFDCLLGFAWVLDLFHPFSSRRRRVGDLKLLPPWGPGWAGITCFWPWRFRCFCLVLAVLPLGGSFFHEAVGELKSPLQRGRA